MENQRFGGVSLGLPLFDNPHCCGNGRKVKVNKSSGRRHPATPDRRRQVAVRAGATAGCRLPRGCDVIGDGFLTQAKRRTGGSPRWPRASRRCGSRSCRGRRTDRPEWRQTGSTWQPGKASTGQGRGTGRDCTLSGSRVRWRSRPAGTGAADRSEADLTGAAGRAACQWARDSGMRNAAGAQGRLAGDGIVPGALSLPTPVKFRYTKLADRVLPTPTLDRSEPSPSHARL
jgi:hypothetical protein